jgi:hypothetical protein
MSRQHEHRSRDRKRSLHGAALPLTQARDSTRLFHQQRQYRLQMIVRQFLQFVIGAILHRMRNEHIRRIRPERLRLGGGGIDELRGGDADRRNSAGFQVREVMRTARRAGASVSQSFDHEVHLAHDLPP